MPQDIKEDLEVGDLLQNKRYPDIIGYVIKIKHYDLTVRWVNPKQGIGDLCYYTSERLEWLNSSYKLIKCHNLGIKHA